MKWTAQSLIVSLRIGRPTLCDLPRALGLGITSIPPWSPTVSAEVLPTVLSPTEKVGLPKSTIF